MRIRKIIDNLYFTTRSLVAKGNDAYYRIRTESEEPFSLRAECRDGHCYRPTPYWMLPSIIDRLEPTPNDVVFDIGCGKGRVVAMFSRCRVRKVIGIEINPALAQVAADNAQRVRGRRSPIQILNENAANVNFDSGTIFFLFNPFGPDTIGSVLSRIRESMRACPRRVQIAYYNPKYTDAFEDASWLEFSIWEKKLWLRSTRRVLFAVSRPQ